MSTPIKFEDIRKGDTIRTTHTNCGVVSVKTGVVADLGRDVWWTAEGGGVASPYWSGEPTFELIDRPKPPLPTEDGTVIISNQPVELGPIPLVLQDGKWWYLNGESFYHANSVGNRPWKLAKVVEA